MKTHVQARHAYEQKHVAKCRNPGSSRDEKNGKRQRKKHRRMIAGKRTPMNYCALVEHEWYPELQLRPMDRPLAVRQQCRKTSRRDYRQKSSEDSATQELTNHALIWIAPKPCPPDQGGNRAAAEESVGGNQGERGIHRKPAMHKTIYEINDARIEKIQGVLQLRASYRVVWRSPAPTGIT